MTAPDKIKSWIVYLFGISFILGILRLFLNYFLATGYRNIALNGQEHNIPLYTNFGYWILPIISNIAGICGLVAGLLFIAYIISKLILKFQLFKKKSRKSK